jgi:hypothetical protein
VADTPSDPTNSRLRRDRPRREPATINASATELHSDPSAHANDAAGSGDVAAGAATPTAAEGTASTPDDLLSAAAAAESSSAATEAAAPTEDASRSASAEPARRGPGFGPLLGAGLIGGILGAGATVIADPWLHPNASRTESRLAQVEQRVATPPQANLGPLEGRIASLEATSRNLADRVGSAQALAERSAKEAQDALSRPEPSPQPPAEAAASAAALSDLVGRVAALETQAQERAQANTTVQERVAGLEGQVQKSMQADTSLQERVAAVQGRADAAANAAQVLERRLTDQDQRLAALTKQLSERGLDAMAAGLRLTLADRLQTAVDDGAPLGQILPLLGRLNVKPENLRPLEPYAQTGAPTAAALAQEFRPLGQRMLAESRPASGNWGETVRRMMDKVVTVRAVGDPQATDVASVVSRIDDALARGAVSDAAAAWDALPEAARNQSQAWGAKLKARAAADAAAQRIFSEAMSALDASMR